MMDSLGNLPDIITITQAEGRGYLLLPYHAELGVSLCSSFSTDLAKQENANPFSGLFSPFDIEDMGRVEVVYHRQDNCCGTYGTRATSTTLAASDHMSLSLGVGIGNKYVGGSVSGSYDKAIMRNGTAIKTSKKTSFLVGSIHLARAPHLSPEALSMLDKPGGGDAFRARYGDYYVSGMLLGGEAAVVVMSSLEQSAAAVNIKIVAEAHALVFSKETTVAEQHDTSASKAMQFGVIGFDSLTNHGVEIPLQKDGGLGLVDAQPVVRLFSDMVEDMQTRVVATMVQNNINALTHAQLGKGDADRILQSGLTMQLTLTPLRTLREVREKL